MTDPSEMRGSTRRVARSFQQRGAELLFVGSTTEGTQGVRGIAVNLNTTTREYAEKIQMINKGDVSRDLGLSDLVINDIEMVRWSYFSHGFRFIEFFFNVDTYNIRIAFWTKPSVFERFETVYYDIISTISFIDRL